MYKSEKFCLKVLSEMWDFLEVSLGQAVCFNLRKGDTLSFIMFLQQVTEDPTQQTDLSDKQIII